MTLMKAKKPLALLLALLAALSLLGTTALAAGLPEETIAAQTELCDEDCGHTHEEVFSHTEHTEESLPEPEEIAVPVATPLMEQPEPEAGQPSDTSGVIPGSGIYWELNEYGWLMLSGNGSCPTFVSPDDQPWAAVREQITQVWFEDMDALCIPSLAYWFTGCTALTMAEIPYTTPVIGAAAFADCPSLRQIQLYYSGAFTIVPGAFSTGSLTPLLVLFIPEYDSVLGTLAAYDWTEDRRAAYFEDVYGITLLATGYCSNCKRTCSYTVEYEQWTNSEHCVRYWCSNCGYYDAFMDADGCTNLRTTAKELNVPERWFARFLQQTGFLYRSPAGNLMPYAIPRNRGLFRVRDYVRNGHSGAYTLITPMGKSLFRELLRCGEAASN